MKASIREMKKGLSEYLRRAGRGNEIVVTKHGRPVARVMAIAEDSPDLTPKELLRRLKAIPGVIPGAGGKPRGAARPLPIHRGGRSLADLVLEERG